MISVSKFRTRLEANPNDEFVSSSNTSLKCVEITLIDFRMR